MNKLTAIHQQIKACTKCSLREGATQPVAGVGEEDAKYMIIGEAPGKMEDKTGVPFVGLAGKRLNTLVELAGIDVNDCYFTNVCKCRPPANRNPRKAEVQSCAQYLQQEIMTVKPEYIITLGAVPLKLFSSNGIRQMHGTQFSYEYPNNGEVCVIAQYHPAAALHQPRLWAVMLDDWDNLPEKVNTGYIIVEPPKSYNCTLALDTENDIDGKLGQWSVAWRDETEQLLVAPYYRKMPIKYGKDSLVIFHNAKWDLRVLQAAKMEEPTNVVDTMIAAYCLGLGRQDTKDSSIGKSGDKMVGGLGLKYLARRHLGMAMKTWDEVKGKPELVPEYNAEDSVGTYLLFEKWRKDLPQHFWDIDTPLLRVIMAMEDRGVMVDPDFLKRFSENLDKQLAEFNLPLNPFSPDQIRSYVYGTLGIEPWKFTDTGAPAVESEVLETIDDPIVQDILAYKGLYKERGTYATNYAKRLGIDNRIHCEFKQTSTATGRLSSAKPNLQNVVKEGEMRNLFVAPEGKLLVRMDWQQLELRVFAALTQELTMLKALEEGRSIHQETADALGLEYKDGKVVNFLMLYGGTAWKISQEFHVPIDKAKEMIKTYYGAFPGVRKYHEEMITRAHEERKVTNYFGRTRRLDAMFAEDWRVRREGEREAINTPIQGAAAEIVKLAMIDLHFKYQAPMLMQVHDELIFEIEASQAKAYAKWLEEYIPTLTEINGVRFPIDVGFGRTWKEASNG